MSRLAEEMIERALPDLPEGRVWMAADKVYGRDASFCCFLGTRRLSYAVTVQAGWWNAAPVPEADARAGRADCRGHGSGDGVGCAPLGNCGLGHTEASRTARKSFRS